MFTIKYRILVLKRPPEVTEHAKMHIQKIRHLAPEFYGQTHLKSIKQFDKQIHYSHYQKFCYQ